MMEMRWFKRTGSTAFVLQYRQRTWAPSVIESLSGFGAWSEWVDVPMVDES